MPLPKSKFIPLPLRFGAALLALIAAVWVVSTPPQAPAQDHEEMRRMSYDEVTSATLALEELEKRIKPGEDGTITFNLLRATKLYKDPPPVYPEELAKLDGKQVKMIGFMTPYDDLRNMTRFMLFPSPTGCSFCAPPSPREVVFVRQDTKEEKPPFIDYPIQVTGTLKLWTEESKDPGHREFLFVLDMAKVERAKLY